MAYKTGTQANIIVGAAAIFVGDPDAVIPAPNVGASYKETLSNTVNTPIWRNVGYTSNGLELQFAPEFGEVQVDQLLDVAKMYKSGMTVTLNTSLAEGTLENLAFAIATTSEPTTNGELLQINDSTTGTGWGTDSNVLNLTSGELGECPVEKQLIAVGAGGGECDPDLGNERVYTAYRVLSIESVTVSAKRDEATVFDVSFRLLPDDRGRYGQIVDRTFVPGTKVT